MHIDSKFTLNHRVDARWIYERGRALRRVVPAPEHRSSDVTAHRWLLVVVGVALALAAVIANDDLRTMF